MIKNYDVIVVGDRCMIINDGKVKFFRSNSAEFNGIGRICYDQPTFSGLLFQEFFQIRPVVKRKGNMDSFGFFHFFSPSPKTR